MRPFYKSPGVMGSLALALSLAFSWNARRELQSARGELLAVTNANEFLKKTLGDLTIAITAKDREIDRLQHSACSAPPLNRDIRQTDKRIFCDRNLRMALLKQAKRNNGNSVSDGPPHEAHCG